MPLTSMLRENRIVYDTVWFFRQLMGVTPEKKNQQFHKSRSKKLIKEYLERYAQKKLQIGAQCNGIDGWLNVDILPKDRQTVYMDATQPFPFENNTFDYIFSEHMIEHISFLEGEFMLKECYRVLKPGGALRIATPNLQFLIDLYSENKTATQQNYIKFSKQFLKKELPEMDTMIINNFFRDWGHQFIYDKKALSYTLEKAGFSHITFCNVGQSHFAELHDIERHGQEITEEFNKLESLIAEAVKINS